MESTDRTAEEDVYRLCAANMDVTKINIEKGDEFSYNSRSQKLYVRSHWPANEEAKAVIILLHGYSSHSSRPTQGYYESHFAAKGYAYVGLDLHGHGYSEGLKGLVTSVDNLVDDVLSLLIALYSKVFFEFHGEETDSVRRFHLRNYAWNVPFFILGQSMGGSTAMCVANHLGNILKQSDSDQRLLTIAKHFQGCVLFCPAIVLKPPSPFVMAILNNFIVPFFGTASIPEFIQSTNSNQSSIWKNKEFLEYVHRDGYPLNPNGLSFCQAMRFQTGSTIVKLAGKCRDTLSDVEYPFIVFHDPYDKVVQFPGAEKLMQESRTLQENKKLILIEGALHDLMTNEMIFVAKELLDWIDKRMLLVEKVIPPESSLVLE